MVDDRMVIDGMRYLLGWRREEGSGRSLVWMAVVVSECGGDLECPLE